MEPPHPPSGSATVCVTLVVASRAFLQLFFSLSPNKQPRFPYVLRLDGSGYVTVTVNSPH